MLLSSTLISVCSISTYCTAFDLSFKYLQIYVLYTSRIKSDAVVACVQRVQ
jgi:hypothetical protein